MAKMKYGIVVIIALMMNIINVQPAFADQATSSIGITFTGHWDKPGGEIVPPTGNGNHQTTNPGHQAGNGDHLTVVSEGHHASGKNNGGKLPQTGVNQNFRVIQALGIILLILGLGILIKKRDGFNNEKK